MAGHSREGGETGHRQRGEDPPCPKSRSGRKHGKQRHERPGGRPCPRRTPGGPGEQELGVLGPGSEGVPELDELPGEDERERERQQSAEK